MAPSQLNWIAGCRGARENKQPVLGRCDRAHFQRPRSCPDAVVSATTGGLCDDRSARQSSAPFRRGASQDETPLRVSKIPSCWRVMNLAQLRLVRNDSGGETSAIQRSEIRAKGTQGSKQSWDTHIDAVARTPAVIGTLSADRRRSFRYVDRPPSPAQRQIHRNWLRKSETA